jgi:hypothetical protein
MKHRPRHADAELLPRRTQTWSVRHTIRATAA